MCLQRAPHRKHCLFLLKADRAGSLQRLCAILHDPGTYGGKIQEINQLVYTQQYCTVDIEQKQRNIPSPDEWRNILSSRSLVMDEVSYPSQTLDQHRFFQVLQFTMMFTSLVCNLHFEDLGDSVVRQTGLNWCSAGPVFARIADRIPMNAFEQMRVGEKQGQLCW